MNEKATAAIGRGGGLPERADVVVIGGAGMAIPEMSMLAGLFKKKLVAAIVGTIFAVAVIAGSMARGRSCKVPRRMRMQELNAAFRLALG